MAAAVIDYAAPTFLLLCVVVFVAVASEDVWSGWSSLQAKADVITSVTDTDHHARPPPTASVATRPSLAVRNLVDSHVQAALTDVAEAPTLASWNEVRLANTTHAFIAKFTREELYNPTMVMLGSTVWLFVRFEGRNSTGSWAQCPDDSLYSLRPCPVQDMRMISFVAHCKLNSALACSHPLEALPYNLNWVRVMTSLHEREVGPEDPRAMLLPDGRVALFYNGPPLGNLSVKKTIRNMKVQIVHPEVQPPVDLDLPDRLERIEKNWAPFEAKGARALLSRSINPHEVLSCSIENGMCETLASTSADDYFEQLKRVWDCRAIHLGTNAVPSTTPNRMVAIFHGLASTGPKRYYNFVYEFEAVRPWRIMQVAQRPLDLPLGSVGRGFIFTSSLLRVGDDFLVGYNVNDRSAALARLNATTFLDSLAPVPHHSLS